MDILRIEMKKPDLAVLAVVGLVFGIIALEAWFLGCW
jgi:hypothetical protein